MTTKTMLAVSWGGQFRCHIWPYQCSWYLEEMRQEHPEVTDINFQSEQVVDGKSVYDAEETPNACRVCSGGELFELFGHDREGHRIGCALVREGIQTIGELNSMSDEELLEIRGLGVLRVQSIKSVLAKAGVV